MQNSKTLSTPAFISRLALFALLTPMAASADVGEGVVNRLIEFLTGPIAIGGATLVVIILGYLAWIGQLSYRPVLVFVIGCVLVFGGAEIASMVLDEV